MSTHKILAEESVSVTEFRRNPSHYFTDHPIAVINRNQPTGYVMGAELFELLMAQLEASEASRGMVARFQPTAAMLRNIAAQGADLLEKARDNELDQFEEC